MIIGTGMQNLTGRLEVEVRKLDPVAFRDWIEMRSEEDERARPFRVDDEDCALGQWLASSLGWHFVAVGTETVSCAARYDREKPHEWRRVRTDLPEWAVDFVAAHDSIARSDRVSDEHAYQIIDAICDWYAREYDLDLDEPDPYGEEIDRAYDNWIDDQLDREAGL